ncbi:MAG: hypothetical protein JNM88_17250 [Chitinophagaceae bacterium]|nr:hypothetical protein [Chitinophagaceae bacterium]
MPLLKRSSTIIALALLGIISLVIIAGFFYGFWSLDTNRVWLSILLAGLYLALLIYFLFYFRGSKTEAGLRESILVTEHRTVFIMFIGNILFVLLFTFLAIFFLSNRFGKKSDEEIVSTYLDQIRNNRSSLTGFFKEMPKGGDLHHHFTGSIFAETYWDALVERDGWINLITLEVDTPGVKKGEGWKTCSQLMAAKQLPYYKQKVIQQWSVKDYHSALSPSDKHFFDAFDKFRPMANLLLEPGLREIKDRALSEHVSYIETMLTSFDTAIVLPDESKWILMFRSFSPMTDVSALKDSFNVLFKEYKDKNIEKAATTFCAKIEEVHNSLKLDDSRFTIRYLTYGNRIAEPLPVFRRLLLAFESAQRSGLIVGVNFVSPEDNAVSMRDYTLHMRMFEFFRSKYPDVKVSLHAGELTPGLIKPELLKSHIQEAVRVAKADRIGHGVDIASEENYAETLKEMKTDSIAVEINLVSNEFILKVKDDAHPILLYYKNGIPIVLSTDDAGILRTDLTTQFILAASRYPTLSYRDIKAFVRNSIIYSFIEDEKLKTRILKEIDESFTEFEQRIRKRIEQEKK